MTANGKQILVYATFPDRDTALAMARGLVDARLAACVNILGAITSVYEWQGERHEDGEVAALIKTTRDRSEAVIAFVKARHPYENPALLIVPVDGGPEAFLSWIVAQTS